MSLITQSGTVHDDPFEELLRQLSERIDDTVKELLSESYEFGRYEEMSTSRLAEAIRGTLRSFPISVDGLVVDVHLEEFKKPEEHVNGADLYISLVRKDTTPISKGMLVQAKRREKLRNSGEPERLGNQCKRMRRRSKKASYVWIFERDGIVSVTAPQATAPLLQRVSGSSSVGTLITNGLRCNAGDVSIGRDALADRVNAIRAVMRRLSVPTAIEIAVRSD